MKTITRHSECVNFNDALKKITDGIQNDENNRPKLILFFAPENIFEETASALFKNFPQSISMGSTAYHTLSENKTLTNEICVTYFMTDIECSSDFIPEISSFPLKYAQRIQDSINRLSSTENTICLEFTTAFSCSEELVATALETVCTENNITVVGGTCGITQNPKERTKVALNGIVHTNSTVFTCIHNLKGKILIKKENVYIPTDDKFTATAVDIKNRIVLEFNKKPAATALSESMNVSRDELSEILKRQPIGRITENEIYISAFEKINNDNSISWSSRIYNNTKVSILTLGNYKEISDKTIREIKKSIPSPSHVFMIHCDARTEFYKKHNFNQEFNNIYFDAFPNISGFSSHGEQLGKNHFNLTLLVIAFE